MAPVPETLQVTLFLPGKPIDISHSGKESDTLLLPAGNFIRLQFVHCRVIQNKACFKETTHHASHRRYHVSERR